MIMQEVVINITNQLETSVSSMLSSDFLIACGTTLLTLLTFFVPLIIDFGSKIKEESGSDFLLKDIFKNSGFFTTLSAISAIYFLYLSTLPTVNLSFYVILALISAVACVIYAVFVIFNAVSFLRNKSGAYRKTFNTKALAQNTDKIRDLGRALAKEIKNQSYKIVNSGYENLLGIFNNQKCWIKIKNNNNALLDLRGVIVNIEHLITKGATDIFSYEENRKIENSIRRLLVSQLRQRFTTDGIYTKVEEVEYNFNVQLIHDLSVSHRLILADKTQRNTGRLYFLYSWYFDLLFKTTPRHFNLYYLEDCNEVIRATLRYFICQDDALWLSFISDAHDDFFEERDESLFKWEHHGLDFGKVKAENKYSEIAEQITKLEKGFNSIQDTKSLLEFKGEFDIVREKYKDLVSDTLSELNIRNKILKYGAYKIKLLKLQAILWEVCSYSIFTQRFNNIKELWEYHQPSDAEATWCGKDLVHRSIPEIFKFYLSTTLKELSRPWDGHHNSEPYFRQYFLLMIAKEICKLYKQPNYSRITIKGLINEALNALTQDQRYTIKHESQRLNKALELIYEKHAFDIISKQDATNIYNEMVFVLGELPQAADIIIEQTIENSPLDGAQIEEQKFVFHKTYKAQSTFKELFERWGLLSKANALKVRKYGSFYKKDMRAALISNPSLSANLGGWMGESLAITDDLIILDELEKQKFEKMEDIESTLSKLNTKEENVVLAINFDSYRIENAFSSYYKPQYTRRKTNYNEDGAFTYQGIDIPVYALKTNDKKKRLLFISKHKIGTLSYELSQEEIDGSSRGIRMDIEEIKEGHADYSRLGKGITVWGISDLTYKPINTHEYIGYELLINNTANEDIAE